MSRFVPKTASKYDLNWLIPFIQSKTLDRDKLDYMPADKEG